MKDDNNINAQVLTMLASVLQVKDRHSHELRGSSAGFEAQIEALICLHDGMDLDDIMPLMNENTDIAYLAERRRKFVADESATVINENQEKVEEKSMPEKRTENSNPVEKNMGYSMDGVEVERRSEEDKVKKNRLLGFLFAKQNKDEELLGDVERFDKYSSLIDELDEEQQKEVLNAINAGIPVEVVEKIASKDRTPAIMRYMAATYLKEKKAYQESIKSHGETSEEGGN